MWSHYLAQRLLRFEDTGSYFEKSIPASAEADHRAHGDGMVGDPVPGMEDYEFGPDCQPVAAGPPKVFARAYADRYPDDGGYNATEDILIAELVDANGSGSMDNGDEVRTYQYPRSRTPFLGGDDFGAFRTTTHTVTNFELNAANHLAAFVPGIVYFQWNANDNFEQWVELDLASDVVSYVLDELNGGGLDQVIIRNTSPSEAPEDVTDNSGSPDSSQDQFIDVEINFSGLP